MKRGLRVVNNNLKVDFAFFHLALALLLFIGTACGTEQNETNNRGGQGDNADLLSDNADLSRLSVPGVDIGTFSPGTLSYTADVGNSVTRITVNVIADDSNAEVVVNPDSSVDLNVGVNIIRITVTSSDGTAQKVSTVTINRARAEASSQSDNADLSSLSLSDVDIGAFSPGTLSYTADVGNSVTQTTVSAIADDSNAEVVIEKVEGEALPTGSLINLDVGENEITITVTAEDGTTEKIYTVTVTRASPPDPPPSQSDNADLSSLSLSDVDIGAFSPGTFSYTATADNSITQTTVSATADASEADVVVDPASPVSLDVGENTITITVTAQDGVTQKTYTVTVTRESPHTGPQEGTLRISDGTSSQGRLEVFLNRGWGTVCNDGFDDTDAGVACRQLGFSSGGTADYSSQPGQGDVLLDNLKCTGKETRLIDCPRSAPNCPHDQDVGVICGNNAGLKSVKLSGLCGTTPNSVTITGTNLTSATATAFTVKNCLAQLTVDATADDSSADVAVDPASPVDLDVGENTITITVTAEDGVTKGTYTIMVTRDPPSKNADLSGLSLSDADIGTFSSSTLSYTADVANSVTQTTVSATADDSNAEVTIDPASPVSLDVGENEITITVTAEDGTTEKTYTVTVTRASADPPPSPSDNADLSSLSLSDVDIGTFSSSTLSYTADVANSVTQTTVSATADDSNAEVDVNPDSPVNLDVGENEITITVTAEDGTTEKTYTVTVTRASAGPQEGDLRLRDGIANPSSQGRLEVFLNGNWGTVCDDQFETVDAGVACRQLGFSSGGTVALIYDHFSGTTQGDVLLDNVQCTGSEKKLIDCPRSTPNCLHIEDTGVICGNNAGLKNIKVSGCGLASTLPFAGTITLTTNCSRITVEATAEASEATTAIDPPSPIDLDVGENEITITVTAEDGVTEEIYTFTVTHESQ